MVEQKGELRADNLRMCSEKFPSSQETMHIVDVQQ
jgi:hypothetical protein